MKKWIVLILSAILRPLLSMNGMHRNPFEEVKEYITENALKACVGIIMAIAIGTMFTAGIVLAVINLTTQMDAGLTPTLSATMAGGLGIFLFSLLVISTLLYFSKHDRKSKQRRHRKEEAMANGQALEETLANLINEFVKERETKRAMKEERRHMREERRRERDTTNSSFETH